MTNRPSADTGAEEVRKLLSKQPRITSAQAAEQRRRMMTATESDKPAPAPKPAASSRGRKPVAA